MRTLLEVRDKVWVARLIVDCAFMACDNLDGADLVQVALDVAVDKLKEIEVALVSLRAGSKVVP